MRRVPESELSGYTMDRSMRITAALKTAAKAGLHSRPVKSPATLARAATGRVETPKIVTMADETCVHGLQKDAA